MIRYDPLIKQKTPNKQTNKQIYCNHKITNSVKTNYRDNVNIKIRTFLILSKTMKLQVFLIKKVYAAPVTVAIHGFVDENE